MHIEMGLPIIIALLIAIMFGLRKISNQCKTLLNNTETYHIIAHNREDNIMERIHLHYDITENKLMEKINKQSLKK